MKAFVTEPGSEEVLDLMEGSEAVWASRLSYVECVAAIARGKLEGRISVREESSALARFHREWPELAVVEFDHEVAARAGETARGLLLRAADAIHLASARLVGRARDTRFLCWDRRLWRAAAGVGFVMLPATLPGERI